VFYSGQHGRIFIKPAGSGADAPVGSLRNWSLNMQLAVLDTTTMAATDRTIIAGPRSYTGAAQMLYYREATSNVRSAINQSFRGASRTDIDDADFGENFVPGKVRLKLNLNDGGFSGDITCICFITNFSISCAVGEVVTADISFEGSGLPQDMGMIPGL